MSHTPAPLTVNYAPPTDLTLTHEPGEPSHSAAPPVQLVHDTRPGDDRALLEFIRGRTRLHTLIHTLTWVFLIVRTATAATDRFAADRLTFLVGLLTFQVALAIPVWCRWLTTCRQYTVVGWASVSLVFLLVGCLQFDALRRPELTAPLFTDEYRTILGVYYASSWALIWSILILADAALYPRTARWCLGYGLAVTSIPIGVIATAYAVNPALTPTDLQILLGQTVFWATIGIGLGMAAQNRLESLRNEVEQAKRFGQYRLLRKLGAGGMGEVHLAEHLLLKRPSVIKMVRADRAGDAALLARFEREVTMLATLTHPNTVQVYDYGHTADGTFYYVMEYLPGLDLGAMVDRHGPFPTGRAVYVLRQVVAALREAHAAGLIHRDIKPSNVMLCERGGAFDVAKLLDFGLVQTGPAGADRLTWDGAVIGTPAFMSPEQAAGLPTDARSDVYSFGATAYFLLTGQPPFTRATLMLTLTAHITDTPPVPPGVPADLAAVVLRCLAKNPADRFVNVRALDAALAACGCAAEWSESEAAIWWAAHLPATGPRPSNSSTGG